MRELTGDYIVFISYRRGDTKSEARLIHRELLLKGIKSFIDIEDLGSSFFDTQLSRQIQEIPNFVVLLSPGAFDGRHGNNDMFCDEISCALNFKKMIIPIFVDGFTFDKCHLDLPPEKSATCN